MTDNSSISSTCKVILTYTKIINFKNDPCQFDHSFLYQKTSHKIKISTRRLTDYFKKKKQNLR